MTGPHMNHVEARSNKRPARQYVSESHDHKPDAPSQAESRSAAKHTAGPVEFRDGYILAGSEALKVVGVQTPCVVGPSRLEAVRNSQFIADAFNVAHETGLTPRQLAEQRDELLAALRSVTDDLEKVLRARGFRDDPKVLAARAALAKTGGAA